MTSQRAAQAPPLLALAFGLVAAPAAWTVHLVASSALVALACEADVVWPLHLATALALLVAAVGGLVALRSWRGLGSPSPGQLLDEADRDGLLALGGVYLSTLFVAVLLFAGAPNFFLDPCIP